MEQTVTLNVESREQLAIVHLEGSLAQLEVYKLKARVERMIMEGVRYIVFDLKKLGFMDSAGIGAIVNARAELIKFNGGIALTVPASQHVQMALHSSQLVKVISCGETVDQAINLLSERYGYQKPREREREMPGSMAELGLVNTLTLIMTKLESIEARLARMEQAGADKAEAPAHTPISVK